MWVHFFILAFQKRRTPEFEKLVALLTPALISVSLIFKTGGIRAGRKRADKVHPVVSEILGGDGTNPPDAV